MRLSSSKQLKNYRGQEQGPSKSNGGLERALPKGKALMKWNFR